MVTERAPSREGGREKLGWADFKRACAMMDGRKEGRDDRDRAFVVGVNGAEFYNPPCLPPCQRCRAVIREGRGRPRGHLRKFGEQVA